METGTKAPRRRHADELKARVLAACAEPGASVAAVAQAHGLNANLVHKWRRGCGAPMYNAARPVCSAVTAGAEFIALVRVHGVPRLTAHRLPIGFDGGLEVFVASC